MKVFSVWLRWKSPGHCSQFTFLGMGNQQLGNGFPYRKKGKVEDNCSLLSGSSGCATPSTGGPQGAGPGNYWGFSGFMTCLFLQPTQVPCSIQHIYSTNRSILSNCKHPGCQQGTSPRHPLIATHEATTGFCVGCDGREALMLHCYWRGDDTMLRTGLAVCYLHQLQITTTRSVCSLRTVTERISWCKLHELPKYCLLKNYIRVLPSVSLQTAPQTAEE